MGDADRSPRMKDDLVSSPMSGLRGECIMLKVLTACAVLVGAMTTTGAMARPVYLAATGSGAGTDSDRSTADQQADDQAQSNMASTCPGVVNDARKTFDQCTQLGDNWVCNVSYRGTCQVGQ